jgi:hypothetical protein
MSESERAAVVLYMPRELRRSAKVFAARHDMTLNATLLEALESFLSSKEIDGE